MLKRLYTNEADIPAEYKSQYVQKEGKWVLDVEGFDNVDSVLEKNRELLTQHNTDKAALSSMQGQLTKANNEKAELASKSVPDGHVVVPVAEKAYIDKLKPLGAPEEIVTKVTEHPTLKEKAQATERAEKLTGIAETLGFNAAAFAQLPGMPGPEAFEIRDKTENGQPVKNSKGEIEKVVIVRLTENGQQVEKNFLDHFYATPSLKLWEPSLKATPAQPPGRTLPPQRPGETGGDAGDIVTQRLKTRETARQANPNPLMPKVPAVADNQTGAPAR